MEDDGAYIGLIITEFLSHKGLVRFLEQKFSHFVSGGTHFFQMKFYFHLNI